MGRTDLVEQGGLDGGGVSSKTKFKFRAFSWDLTDVRDVFPRVCIFGIGAKHPRAETRMQVHIYISAPQGVQPVWEWLARPADLALGVVMPTHWRATWVEEPRRMRRKRRV